MPVLHILSIEDEPDIQELIRYNLKKEGYKVSTTPSFDPASEIIRVNKPDLILLDLMLPGLNGLEICKVLKNNADTKDIPIIMVTAKGEENDIVTGLELGAEDYILKPFSIKVLSARVKTILHRTGKTAPEQKIDTLKIDALEIHPGRHEVHLDGKTLELTASEFSALYLLANKPGWVFTRHQIVEGIRGDDYPVTDRSIDVLIVGLRRKLGNYGKIIATVRGIGYKFMDV
ncbi:MAG: response regulator transcription factor [Fibrobacteria bacterium]|nr:response regulator transcription factor [Fibrobacteria bacterium]